MQPNAFSRYHALCPDTQECVSHYLVDGDDGPAGTPTIIYGYEQDLFRHAMRRCVGIPDVVFRRIRDGQ